MQEMIELARKLSDIDAMVVEDDEVANKTLSNSLDNYFRTIFSAANAEEALTLFRKRRPQVVFIDIIMPGIDGLELAERLLEKNKDQIIIMISASDQQEHIEHALKLGVTDFISKPFGLDKLHRVLLKVVSLYDNMRYQFSYVTTAGQNKKLQAIADIEHTTRSAIVYRAVEEYLKNKEKSDA